MNVHDIFPAGGLIVSCQALEDEPLHGGDTMAKMAVAAVQAGAVGIRTNGVHDIRAIKQVVNVPVIGLIKRDMPRSDVFITPTLEEVNAILEAGADIVALDMTDRENRLTQAGLLVAYIHAMGRLAMADVSTLEEGLMAEQLGADFIGTTLSGYTPYSPRQEEPDFDLLRGLCSRVKVPVIAEGRIWTPEDAARALETGAANVVVGSAITRPQLIVARYVDALAAARREGSGNE